MSRIVLATISPPFTVTTLHYTTLFYTTPYYTTLHYTKLHYSAQQYTYTIISRDSKQHDTTRHYNTVYTTQHFTTPRHGTPHGVVHCICLWYWSFRKMEPVFSVSIQTGNMPSLPNGFFRMMFYRELTFWYEPRHDKTNNVVVRPAQTQISLGIRPVQSDSALSA